MHGTARGASPTRRRRRALRDALIWHTTCFTSNTGGLRAWYANATADAPCGSDIASCAKHEALVRHCTAGMCAAAIAKPSLRRQVFKVTLLVRHCVMDTVSTSSYDGRALFELRRHGTKRLRLELVDNPRGCPIVASTAPSGLHVSWGFPVTGAEAPSVQPNLFWN